MQPDTVVTLGDFAFQGFEIPDRLPFGGEQGLVTHQMPGGIRIVDAMGRNDAPIEWSGRFRGIDAGARAATLDAMRIAGQPLTLTWGSKAFSVIIAGFHGSYERAYEIPYSITCTVVSDLAAPTITAAGDDLDGQIDDDMAAAAAAGDVVDDDELTDLLNTLQDAIAAVPSFVSASTDVLGSVAVPLMACQTRTRDLIGFSEPLVDDNTVLGGVVPYAPFGTAPAALAGQIAAFDTLSSLYALQAVLGRMSTNLSADGVSGRLVTMAGGDLYHVAATQYGTATAWTTIARANGLTDPVLTGIQTLTIPPTPDGDDGILAG